MKSIFYSILIMVLLPSITLSQKIINYGFNSLSQGDASVLYVEKTDTGLKGFIVFSEEANLKKKKGLIAMGPREIEINVDVLHVYKFVDGKNKLIAKHMLDHVSFPLGEEFTVSYREAGIKKTQKFTQNDIVTYEILLETYPELSNIKYVTDKVGVFPEVQYSSELNVSWKGKIKGFSGSKYERLSVSDPTVIKPKKKKKLGGMLTEAMNDSYGGALAQYKELDGTDLDWEENYNGGQDKKNHWVNHARSACNTTGNLIALNGKKKDNVKGNEDREFEVVMYDYKGNVVSREELNQETFWTRQKYASYSNLNEEDNSISLESMSVSFKPNTGKKVNKEGNKSQMKVINLNKEGKVQYDHTYDLTNNFRLIDTIIVFDNNVTATVGASKDWKFVAISTPDSQQLIELPEGMERTVSLIQHKDLFYYVAKRWPESREYGYTIIPIKNGEVQPEILIDLKLKDREAYGFDFIINDEERLVAVVKEFGKPPKKGAKRVFPTYYSITEPGATAINNFEEEGNIMAENAIEYEDKIFRMGDSYFLKAQKYFPDPKNSKRTLIVNTITEVAF